MIRIGWTLCGSAVYVHTNVRDRNGRYAHRWDQRQAEALKSYLLIDQASAARAYFVVAHAVRGDERGQANDGGSK